MNDRLGFSSGRFAFAILPDLLPSGMSETGSRPRVTPPSRPRARVAVKTAMGRGRKWRSMVEWLGGVTKIRVSLQSKKRASIVHILQAQRPFYVRLRSIRKFLHGYKQILIAPWLIDLKVERLF